MIAGFFLCLGPVIGRVCPHCAHTSGEPGVIQHLCNVVEVVVEEIGVYVQGHRCGGMAQHSLHGFDVRAGGYSQTRCRVAHIMPSEGERKIRAISRLAAMARTH